jgi:hypothetical protein
VRAPRQDISFRACLRGHGAMVFYSQRGQDVGSHRIHLQNQKGEGSMKPLTPARLKFLEWMRENQPAIFSRQDAHIGARPLSKAIS